VNNLEDKGLAKQIVSIKKVLVAVDLSHHSEATAFYAAGIANQFGASLTIVHVYEPVPLSEYTCESTFTLLDNQHDCLEKILEEIAQKVRRLGVSSDSFFLVGEPAGKNFWIGSRDRRRLDRHRQSSSDVSRASFQSG
jgi:hypothetical protein